MTSLEPVAPDIDDQALNDVFDVFRNAGRDVPMLYRLLGNSPAMLHAWVGLAWPLRSEPTSSRGLRELLIMRVGSLTNASFEWQAHWPAAIAAGVSPEQLAALSDWSDSELFNASEKAALRCTQEMIESGGASPDAVQTMREHFSVGECVELLLTAAFYSCVSHTLLSFGVEAARDPDSTDESMQVFDDLTA